MGDSESKELYIAKKKKNKRALAEAKEMEGKKIAHQLKQNNSEAFKCLFRMAKQSKNNNKDIEHKN